MALTERVRRLLEREQVAYEVVPHREAFTAQEVAQASHVPGRQLAKALLVREGFGSYLMVVLPASCRLDLHALEEVTGRRKLALATEDELRQVFPDCEVGAMPPFGGLYGLPVYLDACFAKADRIVFQAGNHHEVARMQYRDYERLAGPVEVESCLHGERKTAA